MEPPSLPVTLHRYYPLVPWLWLCCLWLARGEASETPITEISTVKSMSTAQAETAAPVRIRGIVIESDLGSFLIHDGNQGIYVMGAREIVPAFGREVVVEGTTGPGAFAPLIKAQRVTITGSGRVVPRVIKEVDDLETGVLDCQWVQVEGILHSAQPPSAAVPGFSAYAMLTSGSEQLRLSFSNTSFAEVKEWVGARLRLQMACLHYFNSHGQLYGAYLVVPRTDEVQVIEHALPRGEAPLVRIDSLLRYSPQEPPQGRRVHVRGVVTYCRGETELFVQQEQRGVYVQHSDQRKLSVGDLVDVMGFVRRGVYSPEIEDAEIELVNQQGNVRVHPVSAAAAWEADSELVEVNGLLLDQVRGAETTVLTVKGEGALFTVVFPQHAESKELPAIGSLLQLTGVVRIVSAPVAGTPFPWKPETFELCLRTANDLRVLERPAVSLAVWVFGGATVLTSVALLVAGTLWWQSKAKLREQKRQRVAREAEFATVIKERMRLAREIHDGLAQGYTAVSIQLEIAKHKLPPDATVAYDHIDKACALVRGSLAEARHSIQGLRSETLSNADFSAALKRAAEKILKDTAIEFHQNLEGNIARLGAEAENELLRIAIEAMTNTVKHAQAKNIHVTCRVRDDYGELRVSDDGVGYDGANPITGFGLRGMQERAHRLNGHLVVSSEPGLGTHIIARIPLEGISCSAPPSDSSS
jgi:signal transduction histidine kinase